MTAERDMNPYNATSRYFRRRGGIFPCDICGIKANGSYVYHFKDSEIGREHLARMEAGKK